jgi:hypothetical protein
MKRKFDMYVVTYDNDKILNDWFIQSLSESMFPRDTVRVTIINNYSDNLNIDYTLLEGIDHRVFHNVVRPDWSHGHLARNWNQALLHGFKDLTNPESEMVVCVQNDTKLVSNWYADLVYLMDGLDFMTLGAGDQFMVWRPEAVNQIGMFDERFSGIGYQEGEYFLRAILYHKDKVSINDYGHARVYNPKVLEGEHRVIQTDSERGIVRKDGKAEHHFEIAKVEFPYLDRFYDWKWGPDFRDTKFYWDMDKMVPLLGREAIHKQCYMYPYYEKHITNKEKLYAIV